MTDNRNLQAPAMDMHAGPPASLDSVRLLKFRCGTLQLTTTPASDFH